MDNQRFRKALIAAELLPNRLAINEVDIIYTASKKHSKSAASSSIKGASHGGAACGLTFNGFVQSILLIGKSLDVT